MTAIETATAFCRAWFEQRDPAKALTFVSDNVDFAGTAKNECAHSAAELGAYIRGDIAEIAEPFTCSLNAVREQTAGGLVSNLAFEMNLRNSRYIWRLQVFSHCSWKKGSGKFSVFILRNRAAASGETSTIPRRSRWKPSPASGRSFWTIPSPAA